MLKDTKTKVPVTKVGGTPLKGDKIHQAVYLFGRRGTTQR